MKMKKILPQIILASLIGLNGCVERPKEGIFRGYEVRIRSSDNRSIRIENPDSRGVLVGNDYENDGRFDKIELFCPKGDPLEKYTNLDSLETAYKDIMREK